MQFDALTHETSFKLTFRTDEVGAASGAPSAGEAGTMPVTPKISMPMTAATARPILVELESLVMRALPSIGPSSPSYSSKSHSDCREVTTGETGSKSATRHQSAAPLSPSMYFTAECLSHHSDEKPTFVTRYLLSGN
jgi:hypothetical protein